MGILLQKPGTRCTEPDHMIVGIYKVFRGFQVLFFTSSLCFMIQSGEKYPTFLEQLKLFRCNSCLFRSRVTKLLGRAAILWSLHWRWNGDAEESHPRLSDGIRRSPWSPESNPPLLSTRQPQDTARGMALIRVRRDRSVWVVIYVTTEFRNIIDSWDNWDLGVWGSHRRFWWLRLVFIPSSSKLIIIFSLCYLFLSQIKTIK